MSLRLLPRLGATLGLTTLALSGCATIPADAEGTLDRAQEGTLVVGVSEHKPWTDVDDETGQVTGTEADLIMSFADGIDADVDWRTGAESVLAGQMKAGEVDVLIGGLTASSPWSTHMALTRPYTSVESDEGETEDMVMGVRLGENALLVALERHLAQEHGVS